MISIFKCGQCVVCKAFVPTQFKFCTEACKLADDQKKQEEAANQPVT